jgi:schlafen-like transcriptional regulator
LVSIISTFNNHTIKRRTTPRHSDNSTFFDITKITTFEVIAHSAIKASEEQKITILSKETLTKLLTKLIPNYFSVREEKNLVLLLACLVEPQSASTLSQRLGLTDRTLRNRYLSKLLQAAVIEGTIPEKPTSRNQRYKLK